jgi:hypothetical protein
MRDTADVLVLVVESWLRDQQRANHPPPTDSQRHELQHAFTAVALAAPHTASRCPALMRLLSPAARDAVDRAAVPQAQAIRKGFESAQTSQADSEVSVKEAAELMRVTPQAVRLAAAKGNVTASKRDRVWHISRASAQAYRRQQCQ